ncbi:MAG: TonB-dependent receptor [Lewinellaceae bacterium]|nr:TonB-dependent receptor [Lewinellaceae bacterium]
MKYLILFITVCLLSPITSMSAQQTPSRKIYGIVTDENSELLIGASVYWADTNEGTVTNATGQFWLPARDTAATLAVKYVGYNPTSVQVMPGEDSLWVEITGITQLREVTVSEKNFDNKVSTIGVRNIESISSKELRKAPCCNLSESFETNGAVDLVYSNALTGIKEIQMLGLRGVYSQFMVENRPTLTGIATPFAFEYIPGTWLDGIQLAKGASTVKNGNTGISGQINAEIVKPHLDKPFFLNAFTSTEGRGEMNLHLNKKLKAGFSNGLLLHGSFVENKWDMNNDNFYDAPNRQQLNALYRVFYESPGVCGQFNVQALTDRRQGGQISATPQAAELFAIDQRNDRVEIWGKVGKEGLFGRSYNQIGNMASASWHRASSVFGHNTYEATQQSVYWQSLYQTIIGTTNNQIVIAPSVQYDNIQEKVNEGDLSRIETVAGMMAEYTFSRPNLKMGIPDLVVVLGSRIDWNSRFGWQFTPRASAKYNFTENTIVRASAGYGYRSPNLIAENISLLASNRSLNFASDISNEAAWNYGINFTQNFKLAKKSGSFSLDLYRTDFDRQVLIDVDQSPTAVYFYNAAGTSYANSLLAMLQYNPLPGLDVKFAYKWNDVRATYSDGVLRTVPLVAKHRGLVTLDYTTPNKLWMINTNVQIVGPQRLPDNSQVPHEYTHGVPEISPTYALLSGQITRRFAKWELYLGGENLTNYRLHNAIIAVNEPWSPYFNGSQVWAPTMGTVVYMGARMPL